MVVHCLSARWWHALTHCTRRLHFRAEEVRVALRSHCNPRGMSDAVLRARTLYQRQKYDLALQILESNVLSPKIKQFSPEDQFVIYDLLAALQEKLSLWARARKSAALMIQLQPQDARGYLRLGKIMQQIPGKMAGAVRVYRKALVAIQRPQPAFEEMLQKQLRNCSAKLSAELAESSQIRVDFVKILPRELLVLIFQELSLKERVRLACVSRSWRDFVYTEASFWTLLDFETLQKEQLVVLPAKTLLRYANRATNHGLIDINMHNVVIKDAQVAFDALLASKSHAARIRRLQCNLRTHAAHEPLFKMLRTPTAQPLTNLQMLCIKSDTPDRDIAWALESLPALEVLEVATTGRHRSPTLVQLPNVVCQSLRVIKILGQSATPVLTQAFALALSALSTLTELELHRVVALFWPTLYPAAANSQLTRLGFTAEGLSAKEAPAPLPRFSGPLESLTLNDLSFSYRMPALIPSNGQRWIGGSPDATMGLKYVELKRSSFTDVTLPHLLWGWKCADSLETLVVHSTHFTQLERFPRLGDPAFEMFPKLTVLQYTGMHALPEDTFEWMVSAFPNLRKVNFDGTAITGPKLVRLINLGVRVVRCKGIMDVSADTIVWARSQNVSLIS